MTFSGIYVMIGVEIEKGCEIMFDCKIFDLDSNYKCDVENTISNILNRSVWFDWKFEKNKIVLLYETDSKQDEGVMLQ